MECNSCSGRVNPCCVPNGKQSDCEQRVTVDWVPGTACTLGVTFDGITDTLPLKQGIKNCETKTHMDFNQTTGCIEYQNEQYVASDGQQGSIERVCASELANFMDLEDLANVEKADPGQCALLTYKMDPSCGPGCTGVHDQWIHWYANENKVKPGETIKSLAVFTDGGCLRAWDAPTGNQVATIIGRNGKWELDVRHLPDGVSPNEVGVGFGNKNIYGVYRGGTTPDKTTFIATHSIDNNECGDLAFTSGD